MKMKKPRIFSGIKPTGGLHIGNYLGAMKQFIEIQKEGRCFYSVVDLHAITLPQDPKVLKEKTREVAAFYLASGIDPKKSALFVQSQNPDHSVLAWILNCLATMGQMQRMTQYKAIAEKLKGEVSVGVFDYPALMAADILLYQADLVPVGEDQKQHVELTRDLAQRFNSRYGEVFQLPRAKLLKTGARIMSLQDPEKKMSKSDEDFGGTIDLLDSPDQIRSKIKSAVTDSGKEIAFEEEKPAISNLLAIYSGFSGEKIADLENKYLKKNYREFKEDLAEIVVKALVPVQKEYFRIRKEENYLDQVLTEGLKQAREISEKTLARAYQAMGLR